MPLYGGKHTVFFIFSKGERIVRYMPTAQFHVNCIHLITQKAQFKFHKHQHVISKRKVTSKATTIFHRTPHITMTKLFKNPSKRKSPIHWFLNSNQKQSCGVFYKKEEQKSITAIATSSNRATFKLQTSFMVKAFLLKTLFQYTWSRKHSQVKNHTKILFLSSHRFHSTEKPSEG